MERFEKWTETYRQLSIAEQKGVLELSDLELLVTAAYLTGKDTECFKMMKRAHQGYLDRGNTERAARCAFWLGLILMNTGERARGGGWISRGERLLNDHGSDYREKGLFFLLKALAALSNENAVDAQGESGTDNVI